MAWSLHPPWCCAGARRRRGAAHRFPHTVPRPVPRPVPTISSDIRGGGDARRADGTGVLSRKGTRTLTDVERIGVSALAGAMSAFVSGPAELVMIQQQRTGLGVRRRLGWSGLPAPGP